MASSNGSLFRRSNTTKGNRNKNHPQQTGFLFFFQHGSKEEAKISDLPAKLYESLIDLGLQDDFIVDDRVNLTIGRRYLEACQIGYPFVIVIGNKSTEDHPLLELNSLNSKEKFYFSISELLEYIKEHVVSKTTDLQ